MAPRRDPDDRASEGGDADSEEEESPRSRRSARRGRARPSGQRGPVRRWHEADEAEEGDEDPSPPRGRRWMLPREEHPVYWRARDSLYFEPLVAVAIIVLLLVGLYAYTQNWPPVYVVESDSMQHGPNDVLGVINTGDLVLAQRLPTDQITPYVAGILTGYTTYGEYGDVLLYSANGVGSTPIIHRAILYLEWDPVTARYNATDLAGLKCGAEAGAVYSTTGTPGECGVTNLPGTLNLYDIGWRSANVSIDLNSSLLGRHSGFLTMGDNNLRPLGCASNCVGLPDQVDTLSALVEPAWVIGVARGMLPWFGAIKLVLEGNAGSVPSQSWQFLSLTVVGLILLAFGIHFALRAEGVEDQRRKDEEAARAEADAAAAEEQPPEEGRRRGFFAALRPWGRSKDGDDADGSEARPHPRRVATPGSGRHRGRPAPRVRRSARAARRKSNGKDDDL